MLDIFVSKLKASSWAGSLKNTCVTVAEDCFKGKSSGILL